MQAQATTLPPPCLTFFYLHLRLLYRYHCPLAVVSGVFFTGLTMFLSQTVAIYLGQPVQCLGVRAPGVSYFFKSFSNFLLLMQWL